MDNDIKKKPRKFVEFWQFNSHTGFYFSDLGIILVVAIQIAAILFFSLFDIHISKEHTEDNNKVEIHYEITRKEPSSTYYDD